MSLLSRLAVQAARAYGMLARVGASTNVSADYLAVAGGGGGGGGHGGGGGAGGFLTSTATLSTLNTYSIAVGAGGLGGINYSNPTSRGSSGSNSSISGTGLSTVTSTGGGGGGGFATNSGIGASGGSGGGGAGQTTSAGGSGTSGQGNSGGSGVTSAYAGAGGGGGASASGGNGSGTVGGTGGAGSSSSISGSSVTYAGGGGGGIGVTATGGTGGAGGGGNGSSNGFTTAGGNGTVNTGGGGGGGGGDFPMAFGGGTGGSGIVIISYTSATPKFVGGTITTSGGKQIHTFTSSGTLSPLTPITASYLVVAGGGSGGARHAGGGGAGGLLTSSTTLYSGATYVVTVGAGGAALGTGSGNAAGNSGSSSSLSGTGLTTITSTGGGGGGSFGINGVTGGSGGGGGEGSTPQAAGSGTTSQGNAGGAGSVSAYTGGGGGGGANAVGAAGNSGSPLGKGGDGIASSITGSSVTYAGGGGGSSYLNTSYTGSNGGSGGGGAGQYRTTGVSGTANTGGGGGGGSTDGGGTNWASGAGGSGVVIISYAGSQAFNGGLVTSSGGNTIHTFTSTGALTPLTNNLTNSLRFRRSNSAYLSRTPTVAGNQTTWTWSAWVKRGQLGLDQLIFLANIAGVSDTTRLLVFFNSSDQLEIDGAANVFRITSAVFRDPSAWYHIVVIADTTNATANDRFRIYVNGNQQTMSTSFAFTQNANTAVNSTTLHAISNSSGSMFDGYMTDINLIDGQALEPYYFGNNDANGVWKPILYKGTYGTNGFYLTFSDTSALTTSSNVGLGKDFSNNGNYWTTNNISITAGTTYDAMLDVPTNTSATVANYAVLNPLQSAVAPTAGNLDFNSGAGEVCPKATIQLPLTGKWYWESFCSATGTDNWIGVTIDQTGTSFTSGTSYRAYRKTGVKESNGTSSSYGASWAAGDTLGVAVDMDAGTIVFYKNGTSQGTAYSNLAGIQWTVFVYGYINAGHQVNFGQRPFSYTPPTGFVALNTFNLPTPTILQGNKYMDATAYSGTNVTNVIVNQGQFRPDLVWCKGRSASGSWHALFDTVRGATKGISTNSTDAEYTSTAGNDLASFNSNGFTVGTTQNWGSTNQAGQTMVGWQWQAGQGTNTSNTSGSITSTVSVNATAGFSIVTYTGNATANATVGHGLGVAPKFFVVKTRSGTSEWLAYHISTGKDGFMQLQSTSAFTSSANYWGSTGPTSTTFQINGGGGVNSNGSTYVAYCWAEIAGFSAFGSYTGNGSTDGPFVYTGFRPKFILWKSSTDGARNWSVFDSSRNTYNVTNSYLLPNLSNAEGTSDACDFLSNGFKWRSTDAGSNGSGQTFIFMAFAENPFKNSNAR
jgi:hypothetical protein